VSIGAGPVSIIRVKPLSLIGFLPIVRAENEVLRAFCASRWGAGERHNKSIKGRTGGV